MRNWQPGDNKEDGKEIDPSPPCRIFKKLVELYMLKSWTGLGRLGGLKCFIFAQYSRRYSGSESLESSINQVLQLLGGMVGRGLGIFIDLSQNHKLRTLTYHCLFLWFHN